MKILYLLMLIAGLLWIGDFSITLKPFSVSLPCWYKTVGSRRFLPHCQPFRDLNNPHQIIPQWQKDMAHWADRKEIYMSCDFKDFSPRKGFLCKEYFKIL